MKVKQRIGVVLLGFCAILEHPVVSAEAAVSITVGSKGFTESVILGEMLRHLARHTGIKAYHQR